ncbi:hypothetical protein NDU88_005500 [Pleurodeles waltl]|uniref:Uncharacterized protein n=1 Tax=Pleurodeles waltl TaxID=8319 RepID=A0AAV7RMI2_PLEWA|nr:hypothetical protein NDU88_005500 [Pleurodeles waltl]
MPSPPGQLHLRTLQRLRQRRPVLRRPCACTLVPGFSGRVRRWLPESPTPSGPTRQRPERAPRFSYALSGCPALQLQDAPGLGSVSVEKLQAPPERQNQASAIFSCAATPQSLL